VSTLIAGLVPLVVLAALILAALVLAVTRDPFTALPVLLDMLLAASLLRLSATASWHAIATAAVLVAVRKLAMSGMRAGRRASRSGSWGIGPRAPGA